ncbi:hypothetical protein PROPHIGD02-2_24 [Mycobacterium phage prophiGD02-2]|nr:hypothetical protein PROPHIGD02-2_24 [Mycobacterium phage prophiGD02-2]QST87294.1 hypothetical protein PROPHIGD90-1_24 [Mycobacterium phage prophiGD90-1]
MKLEPTEAQRRAMVDKLGEHVQWHRDGVELAVDDMLAAANSIPEGAPVGTIARRPDGIFLAVRKAESSGAMYWQYWAPGGARIADGMPLPSDADSWPVIYDPTKPNADEVDRLDLIDPIHAHRSAQQEPTREPFKCPCCKLVFGAGTDRIEVCDLCVASHPITTRDASQTQQEPGEIDCRNCDGRKCMGCVFREHPHDCADDCPECCEPRTPRVLPSLDCEEARDGTVWQAAFSQTDHSRGWKFWYVPAEREWYTDAGHDGSSPLRTLDFLTERGPYTEVLGDPS